MTAGSHEQRMLIDGALVESDTGKTFDNINPATEEVLGPGGRRFAAPTCTGPSTGRGGPSTRPTGRPTCDLRKQLPLPAAGGAREGTRGAARGAHPRGGLPADDHPRQPARHPTERRAALPDQAHGRVPLADRRGRDRRPPGQCQHATDLEGAGRRRGCHRALELPARGHAEQARAGPGHRQHSDPQAGTGHAVERHPPRPPRRRADRLPERRRQRRDLLRPPGRRGADAVAESRPDLVHGIDRGRQADHGEGRRDTQADVPRARRQVGDDRARRCGLCDIGAIGNPGVLPRRPGLRHPDAHAPPPRPL